MISRLMCSKCGAVYNSTSLKPKVEGICDVCGNALSRRDDDQEGIIRERFRAFTRRHFR